MNPYKIWKCSDFLKFFTTNSLSWDQLSYTEQNEFLNLHYGLIHNGSPTLIDCEKYQLPYIQINIKNYTLCDDGDVIFADASEDTKDICKPVEFINISKNNVVCGLHTIHARDYQNLTILGYKGYLFSSYNFHKQVHRLTQGTKIFSINSSNFKEMFVGIPEKAEQKEIVLFLAKIDERIDTQSKIIEDLKLLKFRLIDSLIGENIPNCIFENLYNFASEGGTPSTSKMQYYENGTIPFVKIDDLKEKYLQENRDYITEDGLSNSSAWLIPTNSIIYSNGATIGKLSINTYPIATKQGILGIIPSKLVIPEYMYYFMQSKYFRKEVHKITVKGTMDCAYLKDLSKIKCYIPSIKEQEKDIDILNCLDEKIKIEYILIKKYKEQKKFLLSNMFI